MKLALALLSLPVMANAQSIDANDKRIDTFMFEEAPVLDGVLDDDAWAYATAIADVHQADPIESGEPSEDSTFLVVYTPDAFYIAGRFHDEEPDKIGAQILTQGDWSWGEDSFTVFIDPVGERRSGYWFDLTPSGIRNQGVFENVTTVNRNWRGIWHGEARITEDG